MSWSFQAVGRPAAVLAKANEDFSRKLLTAKEEEYCRQHVYETIARALSAYPANSAVRVSVTGSQTTRDGGVVNTLNLEIAELFGFLG